MTGINEWINDIDETKSKAKRTISYRSPTSGDKVTVDLELNVLSGIDKELLGRTAASIRQLRPPEPYKGKEIKYAEEYIQRKAGKTGTK